MSTISTPKINDFLYDSFGYDATLVNFYQVVRVISDKTIEVRRVEKMWLGPELVVPDIYTYRGEVKRLRKTKHGFKYLIWDGTPQYHSAVGTY